MFTFVIQNGLKIKKFECMYMESIKDRLAQILRSKNLTASQFAELMEIQPSNVSHLLNGRNKPSLDFLIKLKQVFPEYSFDWIILGKKPMTHVDNSDNVVQAKQYNTGNVNEVIDNVLDFPVNNDTDQEKDSYVNENQCDDNVKRVLESHNETAEKLIVIYGDKTFEVFESRK